MIDNSLKEAIYQMLTCATTIKCSREVACFQVALFARDQMRALSTRQPPEYAPESDNPDEIPDYTLCALDT